MPIGQQNTFYRRGMVLGLTMAEVMLLVLFTLLIALGALLAAEKEQRIKEIAHMKKENDLLMKQAPELREVKEAARAAGFSTITEFWMHIQEAQGAQNEIERLKEHTAHLEESEMQAKAEIEKLNRQIQALNDFEEIYLQAAETMGGPDEFAQLVEKAAADNQNLGICKEKLANTESRCGVGKPACWSTKGRSETIYHVGLTNSGLIIKPRAFPEWTERRKAPLKGLDYGKELSTEAFIRMTEPIYQWGQKEGCVFFVRVYDLTGPTMKEIFKRHLAVVQRHFYEDPMYKNPGRNAQWPEL